MLAILVVSLCLLSCSSFAPGITSVSAQPAITLVPRNPLLVSMGDWKFLNVTLQSFLPQDTSLLLFGVFKNSLGQTVGIATGGITLSAGVTSSAYAVVYNIPPGKYTVYLFAISVPYDDPTSLSVMAQVSL